MAEANRNSCATRSCLSDVAEQLLDAGTKDGQPRSKVLKPTQEPRQNLKTERLQSLQERQLRRQKRGAPSWTQTDVELGSDSLTDIHNLFVDQASEHNGLTGPFGHNHGLA